MKYVSDLIGVQKFLNGKDYLTADEYTWINGMNENVAMTTMGADHQINCIKWLIQNIENLNQESEDVKKEIKSLVVEKMNEFKEMFKYSLKKEQGPSKNEYEVKFNELCRNFDAKLKDLNKGL